MVVCIEIHVLHALVTDNDHGDIGKSGMYTMARISDNLNGRMDGKYNEVSTKE
jgi:hypothetical protein